MKAQVPPPGRTRWEGGPRHHGIGHMGAPFWKDQLGRTAEGPGNEGLGTLPEGPAGKDCWKDIGRRAWVPPLEGPAEKDCWKDLNWQAGSDRYHVP